MTDMHRVLLCNKERAGTPFGLRALCVTAYVCSLAESVERRHAQDLRRREAIGAVVPVVGWRHQHKLNLLSQT